MLSTIISPLADRPDFIAELAQLLIHEWNEESTGQQLERRIKKLRSHLDPETLPTAWIAHDTHQLLGVVALRQTELASHPDLGPWLGGLYVRPTKRHRGLGTLLCRVVEDEALQRGIRKLYLFTLDRGPMYRKLGWVFHVHADWAGRSGEILSKRLVSSKL